MYIYIYIYVCNIYVVLFLAMVAEKLAKPSFSSPPGSLPHCRLLAGSIHPEDSALRSIEEGWTNNPLWKITGYI